MLLVAGAAIALVQPASAQTYKVTAAGTITAIDGPGLFNSSVGGGTPYTFSYLFDYSAPKTAGDSTYAEYVLLGANYGATVAVGDYKFTPSASGDSFLIVANGGVQDNFFNLVSQDETATGFDPPTTSNQIQFSGESSTGFFSSSTIPPLSAYNIANFDSLHFEVDVSDSNGYGHGLEGSVTSLSAQLVEPNVDPVPEASTTVSLGVMLGLSGLVLGIRARRRSRVG